jgi:hypothetical protein
MERICGNCSKTYSSRQSLYNHRKYCAGSKKNTKIKPCKLFIEYGKVSIPTFDGAEFIRPKSDETLLRVMEMLKIPHKYRARILKEEKEYEALIGCWQ